MNPDRLPPQLEFPIELMLMLLEAADELARKSKRPFHAAPPGPRVGMTLRPGRHTPLWNELRAQLRPNLQKYGEQTRLARMLGLPRQRVNEFVTGGGQMPDAERTLQLVAWLMAIRRGQRPT